MSGDLALELMAGWPVVLLVVLVFGSCALSPLMLERMGGPRRFFRRRRKGG
jgi:hypothetical protein